MKDWKQPVIKELDIINTQVQQINFYCPPSYSSDHDDDDDRDQGGRGQGGRGNGGRGNGGRGNGGRGRGRR